MKITKEEVLGIVKKNNLNEEQAEQLLQMIAKGGAGVVIDLLELVTDKSEWKWDDIGFDMIESRLRKMASDIEVHL